MMLVSLQCLKLKRKVNQKKLTNHLNLILKIHVQATVKL